MRSQPNYFDVALFLFHPKKMAKKDVNTIKCWFKKLRLKKSFGPQKFWLQKKFDSNKFCPKSFVKIRSVTAEIFLIWTNVAKKVLV